MRGSEPPDVRDVTIQGLESEPIVITHHYFNLQCQTWRSPDRAEPPDGTDVVIIDIVDNGHWLQCSVRALHDDEPPMFQASRGHSAAALRLFVTAPESRGLSPVDGAVDLTRRQLAEFQRVSVMESAGSSRYMKITLEISGLSRVIPLALRIAGLDLGPRSLNPQRLEPDWMYDI
jgi:hypothetical protein